MLENAILPVRLAGPGRLGRRSLELRELEFAAAMRGIPPPAATTQGAERAEARLERDTRKVRHVLCTVLLGNWIFAEAPLRRTARSRLVVHLEARRSTHGEAMRGAPRTIAVLA